MASGYHNSLCRCSFSNIDCGWYDLLQPLPGAVLPIVQSLFRTCPLATRLRGRDRTSIAELLADERCSQAVIDFLATTDVGRTSGPPVADEDEDAASEASEWEAREQEERAWERREQEERLGRVC